MLMSFIMKNCVWNMHNLTSEVMANVIMVLYELVQ